MSAHTELNSKADFDAAVATKDKYVFILMYEGEVDSRAEDYARKFSDRVASFKVNVGEKPMVKKLANAEQVPTAIIYRDGKEVKRVEGMNPEAMKEVGKMLSE